MMMFKRGLMAGIAQGRQVVKKCIEQAIFRKESETANRHLLQDGWLAANPLQAKAFLDLAAMNDLLDTVLVILENTNTQPNQKTLTDATRSSTDQVTTYLLEHYPSLVPTTTDRNIAAFSGNSAMSHYFADHAAEYPQHSAYIHM